MHPYPPGSFCHSLVSYLLSFLFVTYPVGAPAGVTGSIQPHMHTIVCEGGYNCLYQVIQQLLLHIFVETLGDPYYKRVPLSRVPEYRNLSQDSQLIKPTVKLAAVEPHIISDYPNGYRKIFGRRRSPITPSCE